MYGSGVKEVSVVYEDDHAIFMLAAMFNQFPNNHIRKAYKDSKKDFTKAMEALLAEQKRTKTKPKVALNPRAMGVALRNNESPPIKNQTHKFYALDDHFDFNSVVKWKLFDMQDERHLRILKNTCDPISLDDLLEVGMSGRDQIVQLPCATKKMRCNFTRTSIIECLRARPECPVCRTHYPLPGKMPSGTMTVRLDKSLSCSSYEGDGTIVCTFSFPSGTQGKNHPKPGQPYTGSTRTAYLPHVEDGKKALKLLVKAFKQGELFNIGKSLTSGAENQLTYGSIHLKTNTSGGNTAHGWPDNTYFNRLRDECAAKMIFDESVEKEMKKTNKAKANKII